MWVGVQLIAEKTAYALGKGLAVILCIGESLEEREAGNTFKVLSPHALVMQSCPPQHVTYGMTGQLKCSMHPSNAGVQSCV